MLLQLLIPPVLVCCTMQRVTDLPTGFEFAHVLPGNAHSSDFSRNASFSAQYVTGVGWR